MTSHKRTSKKADLACSFWLAAPEGSEERRLFCEAKEAYLAAQDWPRGPQKERYAKKGIRLLRSAFRLYDERVMDEA